MPPLTEEASRSPCLAMSERSARTLGQPGMKAFASLSDLVAANRITADRMRSLTTMDARAWIWQEITRGINARYPDAIEHDAKADRVEVLTWCLDFVNRHAAIFDPRLHAANVETLRRQWTNRKSKIKKERGYKSSRRETRRLERPAPPARPPPPVMVLVVRADRADPTAALAIPLQTMVDDGQPVDVDGVSLERLTEQVLAYPWFGFDPRVEYFAGKPMQGGPMMVLATSQLLSLALRGQIAVDAPRLELLVHSYNPPCTYSTDRPPYPDRATDDHHNAAYALVGLERGRSSIDGRADHPYPRRADR